MVDPDLQGLVIDPGSRMWKTGFSGDDAPRAVFPSCVGRPNIPGIMVGMDAKDCFVGDECQAKRGILNSKYPIQFGIPLDWNDYEKLYHHQFYNELGITPEEHPVFITDPPLNPVWLRPMLTSVLFETFNCVAVYFAYNGICSLYASGKETGLVVGVGEGITQVTPIHGGYADPSGIVRSNIGGGDVTNFLTELLPSPPSRTTTEPRRGQRKNDLRTTSNDWELVRDLKEKHGLVREEICRDDDREGEGEAEQDPTNASVISFPLPDGDCIHIPCRSLSLASEVIFQPQLFGSKALGVHELIRKSLGNCHSDWRDPLLQNVILDGGSTFFPGFAERLKAEVEGKLETPAVVQVQAPPERKFSAWIGGSILSSLSSFAPLWITKEEYDECGPLAVLRRCL